MFQLHDDHHHRGELHPTTPEGADSEIAPVVVSAWWCTSCGVGAADEQTRVCPDCTYMAAEDGRLLLSAGDRARLDEGARGVEEALHALGGAQLQVERLLDAVDGAVYATLANAAETLHRVGGTLLTASNSLSYARLRAAEGRR